MRLTHSNETVADGELALELRSAPWYDSGDEDTVVTGNVLTASASGNAESQTCQAWKDNSRLAGSP